MQTETHISGIRIVIEVIRHIREAALVCTTDGKELARNPAMTRLLEVCTDPDALILEARILSAAVGTRGSGALIRTIERRIRIGEASFAIKVVALESEGLGRSDVKLVLIRRRRPQRASDARLQRQFNLTRQEIRVLRLVEIGMDNRSIGKELSISPHTVRHHVSSILQKLGLRSRNEIAAALARVAC
jgi:DNA-binding CsgD family transcriptional regulator